MGSRWAAFWAAVIEAVMPEGVEHVHVPRRVVLVATVVIEAVMPEGVEHAWVADQERRRIRE